jgi:ATP synthase protein I
MLIPMRRAVLCQAGVVAAAGAAGAVFGGADTALAVTYGGAVAVVNLAMLVWRWRAGAADYHCDARKHLKGFYRSSMERFFVVGVLLAAGFAVVKSEPLAMLTGFLVAMLAGMMASTILRERT